MVKIKLLLLSLFVFCVEQNNITASPYGDLSNGRIKKEKTKSEKIKAWIHKNWKYLKWVMGAAAVGGAGALAYKKGFLGDGNGSGAAGGSGSSKVTGGQTSGGSNTFINQNNLKNSDFALLSMLKKFAKDNNDKQLQQALPEVELLCIKYFSNFKENSFIEQVMLVKLLEKSDSNNLSQYDFFQLWNKNIITDNNELKKDIIIINTTIKYYLEKLQESYDDVYLSNDAQYDEHKKALASDKIVIGFYHLFDEFDPNEKDFDKKVNLNMALQKYNSLYEDKIKKIIDAGNVNMTVRKAFLQDFENFLKDELAALKNNNNDGGQNNDQNKNNGSSIPLQSQKPQNQSLGSDDNIKPNDIKQNNDKKDNFNDQSLQKVINKNLSNEVKKDLAKNLVQDKDFFTDGNNQKALYSTSKSYFKNIVNVYGDLTLKNDASKDEKTKNVFEMLDNKMINQIIKRRYVETGKLYPIEDFMEELTVFAGMKLEEELEKGTNMTLEELFDKSLEEFLVLQNDGMNKKDKFFDSLLLAMESRHVIKAMNIVDRVERKKEDLEFIENKINALRYVDTVLNSNFSTDSDALKKIGPQKLKFLESYYEVYLNSYNTYNIREDLKQNGDEKYNIIFKLFDKLGVKNMQHEKVVEQLQKLNKKALEESEKALHDKQDITVKKSLDDYLIQELTKEVANLPSVK